MRWRSLDAKVRLGVGKGSLGRTSSANQAVGLGSPLRRPPVFPVCGRLTAGLNSGMKRPIHAFKIGQQVYHHTGGPPGGKRTGPYTIVGLVRQSSGTILFKIKSASREQLAHESELKLVLLRAKKTSDE